MQTAQLLRQTKRPHIAEMAAAIHADAGSLSAEWSRGDELSMIGAETVAGENAARVLLLAAVSALRDIKDDQMASLIEAYVAGRVAEMQFAWRDWQTASALENSADDILTIADEIAERFRKDAEGLAA